VREERRKDTRGGSGCVRKYPCPKRGKTRVSEKGGCEVTRGGGKGSNSERKRKSAKIGRRQGENNDDTSTGTNVLVEKRRGLWNEV